MSDSLALSSWIYVSPDTYRYFFSASAQVFAAIFAIVAIASSFRISVINDKLDDFLRKKYITIKRHYGQLDENSLNSIYPGAWNILLGGGELKLDDGSTDEILRSIRDKLGKIIEKYQQSEKEKDEGFSKSSRIFDEINRLFEVEKTILVDKKNIVARVKLSVIIAAIMTILSLFFLWIEQYKCGCTWIFGIAICLAIGYISWLFISAFKDTEPPL